MSKILGLNIGTNSIGWAVVDKSSNEIINSGVRIFPSSLGTKRYLARQQRRTENRFTQRALAFYRNKKLSKKTNPVVFTLFFCSGLTALITILNFNNWQFWLNISLTTLITTLTLLHQKNRK